jgi:hypothetical protein
MSVSARVALQLDHAARIRRRVHWRNRRHLIEAARFTLAVAHDLNQIGSNTPRARHGQLRKPVNDRGSLWPGTSLCRSAQIANAL